jgi:hypothetical protein
MINDEVLIKYKRAIGYKTSWPEQVIQMKERLKEMKLGFPGIRNDHLTLVPMSAIGVGDIFILDDYIGLDKRGDNAPLMLKNIGNGYYIVGIGCGLDSERDPDRLCLRYGDIIDTIGVDNNYPVCRVDVRPTMNGGPGYYYFFKSYRDFRL